MRTRLLVIVALLLTVALTAEGQPRPACLPSSNWWDAFRVNAYYKNPYQTVVRIMSAAYSERRQAWVYIAEIVIPRQWAEGNDLLVFEADQPIWAWCEVQP